MTVEPGRTAALPANIRFGTSTWTYEGWQGSVYRRSYRSAKEFKERCLEEYAACPLFRCVGIDSTFYSPPSAQLLQRYASQVPASFRWVCKVWERITILRYPPHARYGKLASSYNPDFLNAELLQHDVLSAYAASEVAERTGPFVFQFGTLPLDPADFITRLRPFLASLPAQWRYAVEVRNPQYLCPEYFNTLNECRVTHCFNHWNYMPTLREQMQAAAAAGGLTADFYLARLLTPRGLGYADAVRRFQPYDSVKEPIPEMRRDAARLAKRAMERGVEAFIVVNNRTEGHAPGTIAAIGDMVAAPTANQAG